MFFQNLTLKQMKQNSRRAFKVLNSTQTIYLISLNFLSKKFNDKINKKVYIYINRKLCLQITLVKFLTLASLELKSCYSKYFLLIYYLASELIAFII